MPFLENAIQTSDLQIDFIESGGDFTIASFESHRLMVKPLVRETI
jgi:hypothetical protein